jgi:hypothetical protein
VVAVGVGVGVPVGVGVAVAVAVVVAVADAAVVGVGVGVPVGVGVRVAVGERIMTEITRETVERWIEHVRRGEATWCGFDSGQCRDESRGDSLARSWLARDEAATKADHTLAEFASLTDKINAWAREERVQEAGSFSQVRETLDALWSRSSTRRADLADLLPRMDADAWAHGEMQIALARADLSERRLAAARAECERINAEHQFKSSSHAHGCCTTTAAILAAMDKET